MSDEIKNPSNGFLIPAAIVVAGVIIAGAIIYNNKSQAPSSATVGSVLGDNQPSANQPTETDSVVDVSIDDDPFLGDPNAPVVMIEFSDFECPFCGRFFSSTLLEVKQKYIDTGKVKFVYRDFPLPFHSNAQKAAEAAECAEDQEMFWGMHDMIFENQSAITVPDLKKYAADFGLNTSQFNDCLDSGKYEAEVKKDVADGQAAGVSGTPTFFINGKQLVGAQPFSAFEQVIEAELK